MSFELTKEKFEAFVGATGFCSTVPMFFDAAGLTVRCLDDTKVIGAVVLFERDWFNGYIPGQSFGVEWKDLKKVSRMKWEKVKVELKGGSVVFCFEKKKVMVGAVELAGLFTVMSEESVKMMLSFLQGAVWKGAVDLTGLLGTVEEAEDFSGGKYSLVKLRFGKEMSLFSKAEVRGYEAGVEVFGGEGKEVEFSYSSERLKEMLGACSGLARLGTVGVTDKGVLVVKPQAEKVQAVYALAPRVEE